jgi:hypothetical protein
MNSEIIKRKLTKTIIEEYNNKKSELYFVQTDSESERDEKKKEKINHLAKIKSKDRLEFKIRSSLLSSDGQPTEVY